MEILLGSHHFLLIMKHTPPLLVLPASGVLSISKTEKLSDGVTAVSGTEGVSHVSVKQRMLQSLMSRWKLILALRSSILFSKDWTFASRILWTVDCEPFSSVCCGFQRVSRCVSFASCSYSGGLFSPSCSEESPVASLDSWIKCPEAG